MPLVPKPGFDWQLVNWGGPDQVPSDDCSYCEAAIEDDAVPLRMWNPEGWAAVFCDTCAEKWFGIKSYKDMDEGEGA